MPQLLPGARAALDQLEADLTEALDELRTAHDRARGNPDYSRDCISRATRALRTMQSRLSDLEPMLQRAAPRLEQRVADLERWRESIERQSVVNFRREA